MSSQETRKIYRRAVREDFPESLTVTLGSKNFEYSKVHWTIDDEKKGLRYGTNPHQKGALYRPRRAKAGIGNVQWLKWGKDGPSATNIEDGSRGNRIVEYFDRPTVSIMKHLNPSGVAVQHYGEDLQRTYERAREADPRAAFGSVVVFNSPVDRQTAEEIMKTYVEVVYAPDFQPGVLPVFESKKDIRIGKIEKNTNLSEMPPDIRILDDGSMILEEPYHTGIESLEQLIQLPVPTVRKPSDREYHDLLHAWWVACEVRSNAIILWKEDSSLAIGTGQQDRVGALENCVEKARRFSHNLVGSSLASDGFFPKTDSIELAAQAGVASIIQPGGSVEDDAIIAACNKSNITMVLTGERSFRHF